MKYVLALSLIVAATPLTAQVPVKPSEAGKDGQPLVWSGPDTLTARGRQARDVVNALRPRLAPIDSVKTVTFTNDSTASVDTMRPNGGATYTLHKKQGRWVVPDTSLIWIYRSSQNAPHR